LCSSLEPSAWVAFERLPQAALGAPFSEVRDARVDLPLADQRPPAVLELVLLAAERLDAAGGEVFGASKVLQAPASTEEPARG